MKVAIVLFMRLFVQVAMLLRPGGCKALLAENLLLKHQLLVLHRSRRHAPKLRPADRLLFGLWTLFLNPRRLLRAAVVLISKARWRLIAPELSVRILRLSLKRQGFRTRSVTLVTTLLDAQDYPARELAQLYARRWQIELWFRDIKTSMGMEVLRCKSPAMIRKELEMFFIAYNLIRSLMAQASLKYEVDISRLSFKGTVDGVRQFSLALAQARCRKRQKELLNHLLQSMAADLVPERPGRREPRAVKRRPKPCAWLTKPRDKFHDVQHRNRHWKNNPRITMS
jgi:hypothetical protein